MTTFEMDMKRTETECIRLDAARAASVRAGTLAALGIHSSELQGVPCGGVLSLLYYYAIISAIVYYYYGTVSAIVYYYRLSVEKLAACVCDWLSRLPPTCVCGRLWKGSRQLADANRSDLAMEPRLHR